ncbi:MAG TPA: glycoside hydrolase family 32 protein [Candidatus Sulfotelmatobacter sp.]|nr:glycoside hydrolase family 32 protein [Candidatus Sulfotelmatobacter sp.]
MVVSRRTALQMLSTAALAPGWAHLRALSGERDNSALCRKLAGDPLRPQYHLLPAHNWMNDPNGPIFFRGRYHMFHQYNPQGAVWGNMNWAHATSPDMIHWQHEPIALSASADGPDRDGVFSGSAVLDNGRPTVIYTGVAPPDVEHPATLSDGAHTWRESQCLAVAEDDDLRVWKKRPDPVIAAPPAGVHVTGFRDPCLWREGDLWMLILGSGFQSRGGTILLYSSPDLRQWSYLHPLIEGVRSTEKKVNPVDTGEMWECPDFFPLGGKHVLLISTMGKVQWKVGTYAKQRFAAEKEGVVDWGAYYAAKTMLDAQGNRILWGWITETRPDAELIAAGWAGAMSLPRVLSLSLENELEMKVAPAAQQLRGTRSSLAAGASTSARQQFLENLRIRDLAAELELEFRPKSEEFAIHLQSDAGENFARISVAKKSGGRELRVDSVTAACPGTAASPMHLHIFLDGSVLEILANGTTALTKRIYKIPSGPLMLKLEGDAEVDSLDVWEITPISKDRLTGSMCR